MNKERKQEAKELEKLMLDVSKLQTDLVRAGYAGPSDYNFTMADLQSRYHKLTGDYYHIENSEKDRKI